LIRLANCTLILESMFFLVTFETNTMQFKVEASFSHYFQPDG